MVALHSHSIECIEFTRPRWFLENLVNGNFKVRVVGFKQVLKEQGEQLTCTEPKLAKSLVAEIRRRGIQL